MKILPAAVFLALLTSSCEDVIDIDLDSIEPRLVIEGTISDYANQSHIRLSETVNFFDQSSFSDVSFATITIEDDQQNLFDFQRNKNGDYICNSFQGIAQRKYSLIVETAEESYFAEVIMPGKVEIDSLSCIIPPAIFDFETGFMINCHFQDSPGQANYYRIKAWEISDTTEAESSEFIITDQFQDGLMIMSMWEVESFAPFDTVVVELQTLSKSTYEYYKTLFPISGDDIFGPANPSNPTSNITNDALGYFGAFTCSRDTMIVLSRPPISL
jgi:hypothetical protein